MNTLQQEDIAKEIIKQLTKAGFTAYLCGGCVRDKILGKQPKDYDIVTNAKPQQVKSFFHKTIEVGAKFGIVCVMHKNYLYEIATFRKDGDYSDGRRPNNIVFSDEKEDASRRDFTINGLFYDVTKDSIIDYVGGERDLKLRLIRTIGNSQDRFNEDYLRMIRAIRFATQLNFKICPRTWKSIQAMSSLVKNIAKERIREEFLRMLQGAYPEKAIILLKESGIFITIFPNLKIDENTFLLIQKILKNAKTIENVSVAIAIFLFYCDAQEILNTCEILRLSNNQKDDVIDILENVPKCISLNKSDIVTMKRFLRKSNFAQILHLHYLDCITRKISLDSYHFCQEALVENQQQLFVPKILTGNHLKQLNIPPGPLYKEILHDIENQQLLGNIENYQEAIEYVKNNWRYGKDLD